MAEITAAMVMALRQKTGLPMMDCKKALNEVDGDEAAAVELLNKKAKGKLETRGARETSQGRVGLWIAEDGCTGGIVELRCESAQVAQNDDFVALANDIAAQVAAGSEASPAPEAVLATPVAGQDGKTVQDLIAAAFAKLQENTKLIRCRKITGTHLAGYIHFDGTTGVLLALDAVPSDPKVGIDLCQHRAFTKPGAKSCSRRWMSRSCNSPVGVLMPWCPRFFSVCCPMSCKCRLSRN